MLNCFVDTILSDVFTREFVAARYSSLEWDREVHEIDVLFSVISQVFYKTIKIVTLRHLNSTIFVVVCNINE